MVRNHHNSFRPTLSSPNNRLPRQQRERPQTSYDRDENRRHYKKRRIEQSVVMQHSDTRYSSAPESDDSSTTPEPPAVSNHLLDLRDQAIKLTAQTVGDYLPYLQPPHYQPDLIDTDDVRGNIIPRDSKFTYHLQSLPRLSFFFSNKT